MRNVLNTLATACCTRWFIPLPLEAESADQTLGDHGDFWDSCEQTVAEIRYETCVAVATEHDLEATPDARACALAITRTLPAVCSALADGGERLP